MLLADLVAVSSEVAATPARSAKVQLIAGLLKRAPRDEVEIAASYLSGDLRQRRTGIGWASLRGHSFGAPEPTLTLTDVDAAFAHIAADAGTGSRDRRNSELTALFDAATEAEMSFLTALVAGEIRQGALDGVMVDAISKAADVPLADVRRAAMLRGSLAPIAALAISEGVSGLRAIGLHVGRPVQPMLAQSAPDVAAALAAVGASEQVPAAVDWKVDGIRVQIHRDGDDVHVFTRTLDDITARVPELVELVRALDVRSVVLDGEAVALAADLRPRPFQQTASRTGSTLDIDGRRVADPLSVVVFDVLYIDGRSLLDMPAQARFEVLDDLLPAHLRAPRIRTGIAAVADQFFADAIAAGYEGVVVKSLRAPYEAGRRGAAWVKVKPRHTLDLVVLGAEWGHGRRRGLLSNLHLGARNTKADDAAEPSFVMLGKTFKGMTDELLAWQTEQFLRLETYRDAGTVYVRPELVVEIAFDGVQASTRYPGGVTLRFARVLRYRPDKNTAQADDLDTLRAIHAGRTALS